MDRARFLCGRAASWRGVIGTRRTYACDDDKGRLQLLVTRHPFQSSIRLVPPPSLFGASREPVEVEPGAVPSTGSLSGDAA